MCNICHYQLYNYFEFGAIYVEVILILGIYLVSTVIRIFFVFLHEVAFLALGSFIVQKLSFRHSRLLELLYMMVLFLGLGPYSVQR